MPQQTKIFRVFVSSTFTDMKLERGILQRDAFPKLEKFCEEKGAKFQAVDLRWGVNEESSLNQKTLQICFNEIARCQKISPKPNFLILLGDKYGWQPIPEIVPEVEMIAIQGVLYGMGKVLIQNWYKRDENAIPPEYVLQPRGDALKDYAVWCPIEKELLAVFRAAVNNLHFTPEQRIKYFASATHQEIIRGALNPPKDSENPEKHVFAFSRSIAGLPDDKSADGFIDLMNGIHYEDSEKKLDNLKANLQIKLGRCHIDNINQVKRIEKDQTVTEYELPAHFVNYEASWVNDDVEIKNLQKFNDIVCDALKKVIREQLALVVDKDEINHEVKLHGEFKNRLTEYFEGRENILKTIHSYP